MSFDHNELKRLSTRRYEIVLALDAAKKQVVAVQAELKRLYEALNSVDQEIKVLKDQNKRVIVSEHAILRYLERVKNLDLEQIRNEILPENAEALARGLGNGVFPVGQSHKVRVKNGVVVTILTDDRQET